MKHERTKRKFESAYITETKDFAAEITKVDGKNYLKILSPRWYAHQLSKFKEGEKVTLYISSRKPKRSQQQNRYLWGVYYPLIAQETGERDLDRLHALFKGMFLTKEIAEVLGKKVRVTRSTADLTVSEFISFVMDIEAETGIEAPPTQNYFD